MRLRSIKNALYILVLTILLQLVAVSIDLYYQNKHDKLEDYYSLFSEVENSFLNTLVLEKDAELSRSAQERLLLQYRDMISANSEYDLKLNNQLFEERIVIHTDLFNLWERRTTLHARLNEILPALAESVSYIHKHHLAYIKNFLRRTSVISAQITESDDNRSGSELDIISAAIDIQRSMLELIEVFSRLQRGFSPKNVSNDFKAAITSFYQVTNDFEDFSLDAQDGILVEELLKDGGTFEESFREFLTLETDIETIHIKSENNRKDILSDLIRNKKINDDYYEQFSRTSGINKSISFVISVVLLIVLLYIARVMTRALGKVARETEKIKENHAYRIPYKRNDFREFKHIFNALNLMGEAVSKNFGELQKAQNVLEDKVLIRTKELSLANIKLTNEIEERIKNEQQRRELEEQLSRAEKMEAIGTLAGGVAHDLNNLLSGIVSYPELLLLDLPEDHKFTAPLRTIKNSGKRASIIVEDLLTMARRGVAKHDLLNFNRVMEEFQESHEFSNIKKYHPEIDLKWDLAAKESHINGSKVHLLKAIMNLTLNAAESIPRQGVVTVSTSNKYIDTVLKSYDEVNEGEYLKLRVEDNGIGISPDNLERIFEPFFTTKSLGRSGSGLGMAVVWGVVKDHGGYINIQSKKGEGTIFDLFFPLQRTKNDFASESTDLDSLQARGESVLVVDDIKEQREIATAMLKRLGYQVNVVSGGEAAIAYLRQTNVDIVLLDMIMTPGIDGLETYRQIIEIVPDQKVIIVSGFSENDKVREAQQLGAGPYVKKPYGIKEIASVLSQELQS